MEGLEAKEEAINFEFKCLNMEESLKIMGLGFSNYHVVTPLLATLWRPSDVRTMH